MRLWPTKKEKPNLTENKKTNIFRISYRLRNGNVPLIAEMIIKSKKEKEEINFGEAVKIYWEKNKMKMELEEILIVNKIGEE
jgi:hypothetical protein